MNNIAHYSNDSFWDKLKHWAGKAGWELTEKALWLYFTAQDPNVPVRAKAIIYAALGYFILPVDLIPDALPGVGFSDDLLVLLAAVAQVACYVTPEIKAKTRQLMRLWFGGNGPIDPAFEC